jgi:hypothetical protein
MAKLNILTSQSNDNQTLIESESMSEFKSLLETCIFEYQIKMREKRGNHFDAYKELAQLMGLHYQTLRKYVDTFIPASIPINKLVTLCCLIEDNRPIDYLTKLFTK